MSEANADRPSASESGGDGVRGRSPREEQREASADRPSASESGGDGVRGRSPREEQSEASADRPSASESGGDGVRGRSPRAGMNARPLRIGLLMVGHVDPQSQFIAGDYPELFGAILAPLGIELVPYDLDAGHFPDDLGECDGWVCSPSRLSSYDPVDWLADAEELLRRIIATETPYVGICFGHQLLAQALGGRVEKSPYGWGVGVRDFEVVARKPWMTTPRTEFAIIGSHQDQVVAMPDGAELLFRSDYCPYGGFAIGERAWTIQVHPEFTPELADHLLAGRIELIGASRVAEARGTLTRPLDRHELAGWIASFFTSTTRRAG